LNAKIHIRLEIEVILDYKKQKKGPRLSISSLKRVLFHKIYISLQWNNYILIINKRKRNENDEI